MITQLLVYFEWASLMKYNTLAKSVNLTVNFELWHIKSKLKQWQNLLTC